MKAIGWPDFRYKLTEGHPGHPACRVVAPSRKALAFTYDHVKKKESIAPGDCWTVSRAFQRSYRAGKVSGHLNVDVVDSLVL